MHRRRFAAAALVVFALAACGGNDDDTAGEPAAAAAGSSAVVTVHTFNFQPDPIEVEAGTTITFENQDKINHSVTAGTREQPTPDAFDEGVMDGAGESFELTLDEPGTYDYFCKFHPGEGMTGQIIVR
jgi:plastocyanin